jgi:hypothetical protein
MSRMYKHDEPCLMTGVELPMSLVTRLRAEVARTGGNQRKIIMDALEAHLPKDIRVIVGREGGRSSAR